MKVYELEYDHTDNRGYNLYYYDKSIKDVDIRNIHYFSNKQVKTPLLPLIPIINPVYDINSVYDEKLILVTDDISEVSKFHEYNIEMLVLLDCDIDDLSKYIKDVRILYLVRTRYFDPITIEIPSLSTLAYIPAYNDFNLSVYGTSDGIYIDDVRIICNNLESLRIATDMVQFISPSDDREFNVDHLGGLKSLEIPYHMAFKELVYLPTIYDRLDQLKFTMITHDIKGSSFSTSIEYFEMINRVNGTLMNRDLKSLYVHTSRDDEAALCGYSNLNLRELWINIEDFEYTRRCSNIPHRLLKLSLSGYDLEYYHDIIRRYPDLLELELLEPKGSDMVTEILNTSLKKLTFDCRRKVIPGISSLNRLEILNLISADIIPEDVYIDDLGMIDFPNDGLSIPKRLKNVYIYWYNEATIESFINHLEGVKDLALLSYEGSDKAPKISFNGIEGLTLDNYNTQFIDISSANLKYLNQIRLSVDMIPKLPIERYPSNTVYTNMETTGDCDEIMNALSTHSVRDNIVLLNNVLQAGLRPSEN